MDTMDVPARTLREEKAMAMARPLARTELQERVASALDEGAARRMEVRGSDPAGIPEITREVTMIKGALQGVAQRIAELAGDLEPVLNPEIVHGQLLAGIDVERQEREQSEREFPCRTDLGKELRGIQNTISEMEATLAFLRHAVSL